MIAPIVLFAFNRPETTARVFEAIRQARPSTLFLICDGPRPESPHECDTVRKIFDGIDWCCDVRTDFAPANMGCLQRMSSGISWVLSQVPEVIIFEDDCLPSPSFFRFASEMLSRYRNDPQVMMVGGQNGVFQKTRYESSYTFGRTIGIHGWATWARAWESYDRHMKEWPRLRETSWLFEILGDTQQATFWKRLFDTPWRVKTNWDYQWVFSVWSKGGLSVIPSRNLVNNIGFGPTGMSDEMLETPWITEIASLPLCEMEFPLIHPPGIEPNYNHDALVYEMVLAPQRNKATWIWNHLRAGSFKPILRNAAKRFGL
jgi:hypothetical protein